MNDDFETPKQNVSYSMSTSMGGGNVSGYSASIGAPADPAPADPFAAKPAAPVAIKDITTESFMADVMEASREAPVIVDFWAPWCGPCKQLGPMIEKVVSDAVANGKRVTLCKMDVEKYPEVSQQMGIQSIPAVVAFVNGRPADAFMGAKGEREVRAFVDKVAIDDPAGAGPDMSAALDEADKLAHEGDHGGAAELYSAILAQEPGNLDAFAGLGHCYVAVGELETAQKLIDKVPEEHRVDGPLAALQKTIDLAKQGEGLGELEELAQKANDNPKDHQARFDYALALNAAGEREEAALQLVAIVKQDRTWNDDGARQQLLEFFEAWGHMDAATIAGRRALSAVLFS